MKMCAAPSAAAAKRAFWACITNSPSLNAKPAATALKSTKVTNGHRPLPPKKVPGWLLFAILALGIGALYNGLTLYKKNTETQQWLPVPGKIISASLIGRSTKTSSGFERKITYEYVVNGHTYSSNRVAIGEMEGNYSELHKDIEKLYPAGKEVTVYYNPLNPQEAVLRPGEFRGARFVTFLGIMMVVISLAGLLLPLRNE